MKHKLAVDVNCMLKTRIGEHGVGQEELDDLITEISQAFKAVAAAKGTGWQRWRLLPYNQGEIVDRILVLADKIRSECESFVVLGIGGSALGPIAVHQALRHPRYNELDRQKRGGPKLYVEDNVDPERMAALMDVIDVEKTCFNVVTKSGATSETMAQLLIVVKLLEDKLGDGWKNHVIATTDEKKGNLCRLAAENQLETFVVPDGVGGRFSQLCPVGLLPAAVCGIDIKAMLEGAAYADEYCSVEDVYKNPAMMMAVMQYICMGKGMNISVMMPYADSLKYMSDWYAQLWAESLGKRYDRSGRQVFAGQTPVKALGVTDQHSQVQLFTEGPFDKVVTFLKVGEYRTRFEISRGFENIADVAFLGGHTLNELIQAECRATEHALTTAGRPSFTITLPVVDEFTVGQLLYVLEMQTAFTGELLDIDAFDQPGVEAGKKATFALLGKAGYEKARIELENMPPVEARFVI